MIKLLDVLFCHEGLWQVIGVFKQDVDVISFMFLIDYSFGAYKIGNTWHE
jgi:hypothetical protein